MVSLLLPPLLDLTRRIMDMAILLLTSRLQGMRDNLLMALPLKVVIVLQVRTQLHSMIQLRWRRDEEEIRVECRRLCITGPMLVPHMVDTQGLHLDHPRLML